MIETKPARRKGCVRITFTLPADHDVVSVVGDFNDWDPRALRTRRRGAARSASIEVLPGRYAFRYVTTDGEWFDDDDVQDVEPNGFGGLNRVIDVRDGI